MLSGMDIRRDWKGIAATVIVVAGILIAAWYAITQSGNSDTADTSSGDVITAVFTCEGGRSMDVTFDNEKDTVRLILSDGRDLTVPRAISASGARYANMDESFVFWNKGDSAFIEELGTMTYSGCVTNS